MCEGMVGYKALKILLTKLHACLSHVPQPSLGPRRSWRGGSSHVLKEFDVAYGDMPLRLCDGHHTA